MFIEDESMKELLASSLFMARDDRALVPEMVKLSNDLQYRRTTHKNEWPRLLEAGTSNN